MSQTDLPFPEGSLPFEVRRKAGEGAMGAVYEAFDRELGRPVAVKIMRDDVLSGLSPASRAEARLRFLQEARAAARLSHPGIAAIYRTGEAAGRPFIAMEWLEGESLDVLLGAGAPLPLGLAARIGLELAEALDAAHAAGVIHRDVKPSNLVLGPSGRLKVADFGIARVEGGDLVKTRAGEVVATPMYASPEQLRGEQVDNRSDIFSAGVVLYQTLTGHHPFGGLTIGEVTANVLFQSPLPPSALNPGVPPEVDAILIRALEKERDRRFARALEMAEALRPFATAVMPSPAPSPRAKEAEQRPELRTPFPDAPGTTAVAPGSRVILKNLPSGEPQMAVAVVERWPSRPAPRGPVQPLLARLSEKPLHAEPFSGAVRVSDRFLLFFQGGWLLAALDTVSGDEGDTVLEGLPGVASMELRPIPEDIPATAVPLLVSLLRRRKARLEGLDSTFVNLAALSRRLRDESFDGILKLKRGQETACILMQQGQPVLSLFSEGWQDVPVSQPWEGWISDVVVTASVDEPAAAPLFAAYRLQLAGAEVEITAGERDASKSPGRLLFQTTRRTATGSLPVISHRLRLGSVDPAAGFAAPGNGSARERAFEEDGARRFLAYLLDEMPVVLSRLGKGKSLKYVADWIPLTTRARLHYSLPRPQSRDTDFFDAVTFDNDGKVLHLVQRVARATPDTLRDFVNSVLAAKQARIKTGDIGGAFFIAPSFDEDVAAAFAGLTKNEEDQGRSWTFGVIEAATQYEGFVRMGPRRGFHLVLMEETPTSFELVLP